MLTRRIIRIKVMQALYAYFQAGQENMGAGERELMRGFDKLYDIYLMLLLLLKKITQAASGYSETEKYFPSEEDRRAARFFQNPFIDAIVNDAEFNRIVSERKTTWQDHPDLIRKIYHDLRKQDHFKEFIFSEDTSFKFYREYFLRIFADIMDESENLNALLEEKYIHWPSNDEWLKSVVMKSLSEVKQESNGTFLVPLFKDPEQDMHFAIDLFRNAILSDEENSGEIANKTQNWEVDRIALLDIILMKMALTEFKFLPNIPTKVTLNEYLDISKEYSTAKSSIFINGVLDKLMIELKSKGKVVKTGRGLIE